MIKRLQISDHSRFLKRLACIEQWPDRNFNSPPLKPSLSPLASLPYSCAEITNAFVVLNQKPLEPEPEPDPDPEPDAILVNPKPEPELEPLDRNSCLKDITNRYHRLMRLYHPDKGADAYLPLSRAVNGAYKICSDVIKAIQGGEM